MTPGMARALAAELIGTFALVFAGAGAIMVDAKGGGLGHVGVALSFGLVSGDLHALWVYPTAPLLGAVAAAVAYQFLRAEEPA